jgi:tetratricopeptide (TPR) repeat protein
MNNISGSFDFESTNYLSRYQDNRTLSRMADTCVKRGELATALVFLKAACNSSSGMELAEYQKIIGGIYQIQNETEEAFSYYDKSLNIYQNINPSFNNEPFENILKSQINFAISDLHDRKAALHLQNNDKDNAYKCLKKSMELKSSENIKYQMLETTLNDIGIDGFKELEIAYLTVPELFSNLFEDTLTKIKAYSNEKDGNIIKYYSLKTLQVGELQGRPDVVMVINNNKSKNLKFFFNWL